MSGILLVKQFEYRTIIYVLPFTIGLHDEYIEGLKSLKIAESGLNVSNNSKNVVIPFINCFVILM